MAIIIPSKNIYQVENPKIIDNIIERVEINAKEVTPNNEYETPVYIPKFVQGEFELSGTEKTRGEKLVVNYKYANVGSTNQQTVAFVSYCAFINCKESHFSLTIPRKQNTKIVDTIMFGADKEGNPNIKYTVFCSVKKGYAEGIFAYNVPTDNGSFTGIKNIRLGEGKEDKQQKYYSMPEEITFTHEGTNSYVNITGSATSTAKLDKGNSIISAKPTYENDNIYIDFDIVTKATVVTLGTNPVVKTNTGYTASGEYQEYIPQQIEITIYGNTLGIDLVDKTLYIPDSDRKSKKVLSVEGNELMQTSNYYESENTNALIRGFSNTKNEYSKGKEVAKILCSISDYYSETFNKTFSQIKAEGFANHKDFKISTEYPNIIIYRPPNALKIIRVSSVSAYIGLIKYEVEKKDIFNDNQIQITLQDNVASLISDLTIEYEYVPLDLKLETPEISIGDNDLPMSFQIKDEVIPMIFGVDGKDKPMSIQRNGAPKIFNVIGTRIIYDGAIWQELTLQEKTN